MINTNVLQMYPYVENIIYNLEVVRDRVLEENATCKLFKKEASELLEFITVLSTEYTRVKAENENYSKQINKLKGQVENG